MVLHGFLKEIFHVKQAEIARNQSEISFNTIRREAEEKPAGPEFLPAVNQCTKHDIGIIAEVKKASPSKGDIRIDLDIEAYAAACATGGAKALSVLTESRFFKGSIQDLETICRTTTLPVLRKDFVISAYQIFEAKRAGAASVLLITTMLSNDQLKDYITLTRELGMEPLVEITSEKEFETAYYCDSKVVDINNRNLVTLETDLTISKRIAAIIPDDIVPVEASGIRSFSDIEQGLNHQIFNFLVGESIVRSDEPEGFVKALRNATDCNENA